MRQNRVNPFGQIICIPERGSWLGNRGVIHNESGQIVRAYKLKAWFTCLLSFKERRFVIMAPGRWTQLFFMDEATALAAGHRPCGECRRADFKRFKQHWIAGNPVYGFNEKTKITEIDEIIHRERIDAQGEKKTYLKKANVLPNGVFVKYQHQACLIFNDQLFLWSPKGYTFFSFLPKDDLLEVLTPKSIVATIKAGYVPQIDSLNLSLD